MVYLTPIYLILPGEDQYLLGYQVAECPPGLTATVLPGATIQAFQADWLKMLALQAGIPVRFLEPIYRRWKPPCWVQRQLAEA